MTPGNLERRSSACLLQRAFEKVVVAQQGFEWCAGCCCAGLLRSCVFMRTGATGLLPTVQEWLGRSQAGAGRTPTWHPRLPRLPLQCTAPRRAMLCHLAAGRTSGRLQSWQHRSSLLKVGMPGLPFRPLAWPRPSAAAGRTSVRLRSWPTRSGGGLPPPTARGRSWRWIPPRSSRRESKAVPLWHVLIGFGCDWGGAGGGRQKAKLSSRGLRRPAGAARGSRFSLPRRAT